MVNLVARVDSTEDGILRMRLRGGKGNPIVETWHIFYAGATGIHAEAYDRNGDLVAARSTFATASAALSWLADGAWETHRPDTIQVPPARVTRLLNLVRP